MHFFYNLHSHFRCRLVLVPIDATSSESIKTQVLSDIMQELSSKVINYKSNEQIMDGNAVDEGFMVLSDNRRQSSAKIHSPNEIVLKGLAVKKQNTSSTTCKTITSDENSKDIISSILKNVVDKPDKEISIKKKPNNNIQALSKVPEIENDDIDIRSYLTVDDDALSRQLFKIGTTFDGSGDSMFLIKYFFKVKKYILCFSI